MVNLCQTRTDNSVDGLVQVKTWRVSPDLFPTQLTAAAQSAATAAVEAAVAVWGERSLNELEAEDRLAFACEKAPTEDIVDLQVRGLESQIFATPISHYSLEAGASAVGLEDVG